jgi:hypothetical protein
MAERSSCFVFSLPKAGSVLVNNLVADLGRDVGMTFRSIMDEYFVQGVADQDIPRTIFDGLDPVGHVYGGFRYLLPGTAIPDWGGTRMIFLVRDPRDMLVSQYYSVRSSHTLPGENSSSTLRQLFQLERQRALEATVDEYVIEHADGVLQLLLSYGDILRAAGMRIFRYEDVIFDKLAWAHDIVRHFDWDIPNDRIDEIARRHDVRVDKPNPDRHIRNVKPGDHMEKLRPETIAELDYRLRPVLEAFRYRVADRHFLDALVLAGFRCDGISGFWMRPVAADFEPPCSSLPFQPHEDGVLIDTGAVACRAYWLEDQAGQPCRQPRPGEAFRICYLLHFNRALAGALLGTGIYQEKTRRQLGRNTADMGELSFAAGDQVLVKWSVTGLTEVGEYRASVGVSSLADSADFQFRQHRARIFRVGT